MAFRQPEPEKRRPVAGAERKPHVMPLHSLMANVEGGKSQFVLMSWFKPSKWSH